MTSRYLVAAATIIVCMLSGAASATSMEAQTSPLPEPAPVFVEPLGEPLKLAAPGLDSEVALRAQNAITCAQEGGLTVDKVIVVDMSLPAKQKRLWAFRIGGMEPELILTSRVAHGSGSDPDGDGHAQRFSNIPNSNMTSLGLYRIAERYKGKNGWSRKLDGLFARFNSNARKRAVVLHPSSYVGPVHVGRSHGCPAVNPSTMEALERAGLSNAILWIDAPDQRLAQAVQACAARHEAKRVAQAAKLLLGSFASLKTMDPLLPWTEALAPEQDSRICRLAARWHELAPVCRVDSAGFGPRLVG